MILRGTSLIPGRAQGRLLAGVHENLLQGILLIGHQELPALLAHRGPLPAGIIVRDAARFAHALIRLFSLGIPTVLVSSEQAEAFVPGQWVALDGDQGLLADEPIPPPAQAMAQQVDLQTADGQPIELMASVGDARGAEAAVRLGARSIGLVRSEYLHPEPPVAPDRFFYINALQDLLEASRPLDVTVRLFDYGPDKHVPWWPEAPIAPLGQQGVRLYAIEPISEVLEAELAALDELCRDRPLSLLVPYLTHPWEFEGIRERLQRWPRLRNMPLGAMVETPAAAFALPEWKAMADFVAIGCNDLMQAFDAADRNRPELSAYLDPYAPAWLRFLARLAREGLELELPMRVCGQLPALPGLFPLLIGMGLRSFSVEPAQIPHLASVARLTSSTEAGDLLVQACRASSSMEVRGLLGLART
ncbi:MAG TPA: phosphoenolpyruvate-protein phosphotransferase [Chromatiales bacterium]|nr:phosphoenolpyruvate-protein phosphotransferase [Chromatiales bacterium]